jgi:hypothetical protein
MSSIKKERIKDRMLKNAARVWGVPENEVDINFDPLILLLIDACSSEFEKIGYDIASSQTRLLDRLADLILPEALVGPQPASCVMAATPLEAVARLKADVQFFARQKSTNTASNGSSSEIYFTPIGEFPLHNVSLDYLFIGSRLYGYGENNVRALVHKGDGHDLDNIEEFYLVLRPDKDIQSIKGLSFFFDMRSHSEANNFYKSLENAAGYINGNKVDFNKGYFSAEQFELSTEEMLFSGHDYSGKVIRQAAAIYQQQFANVSVAGALNTVASTTPPVEWNGKLPEKLVQQLSSVPRIYLKIVLNRSFHQEVLDVLSCTLNAYPVINRRLNSLSYRTNEWVNIIPLLIEGSFLDIHDIKGSSGTPYKFKLTGKKQTLDEGEASVRNSGIGKTDSKEVREIIGSLIEAIRDESAFFSEISNEFILARLNEINQMLTRLEDQLNAARDNRAPHHYVLLKPKNAGDQVAIDYWTTNGEEAHLVKAGTPIDSYNHTLVNGKRTYTLSNTIGGRTGISAEDKKLLLKQQLLSKGKIVSAEDIRLLCFQLFGNKLIKAEIIKAVEISTRQGEGFIRTINVMLTLAPDYIGTAKDEVEYKCSSLEYLLTKNASPVYPFRIVVN